MNLIRELDALESYYEANKPWLEDETRKKYEAIDKALEEKWLSLQKILWTVSTLGGANAGSNISHDEDEAATTVHDWAREDIPDGLPALKRDWDAEVERVVRSAPWWRRVFEER